MTSRRPASLDYNAHLHELALTNWRRALLERDVVRAELNARSLTGSHQKLWKFLGGLHLGIARLCAGRPASALAAFAEAKRVYSETHELASLPRTLSAHTHLELGSADSAWQALQAPAKSPQTPETKYWRALALARLSRNDEARRVASDMGETVLFEHVNYELTGEISGLRRAIAHESPSHSETLSSASARVPAVYALAVALVDRDELDQATQLFTQIRSAPDAVLHWPIPYIRSSGHLGDLAVRADEPERARTAYSELLHWWADGEMDRSGVDRATQFVRS